MSDDGAEVVVAPRSADRDLAAASGGAGRQTTTSLPGTTRAPPLFHGSFAASVEMDVCAPTLGPPTGGAPIAGCGAARIGAARRVARARQAAMRARNEVSFQGADRAPARRQGSA